MICCVSGTRSTPKLLSLVHDTILHFKFHSIGSPMRLRIIP